MIKLSQLKNNPQNPRVIKDVSFHKLKAIKFKVTLKILALLDILFASKFELRTFDKNGCENALTKYDSKEISEAITSFQ